MVGGSEALNGLTLLLFPLTTRFEVYRMDFVTWLLIGLIILIVCLVPKLLSPEIDLTDTKL